MRNFWDCRSLTEMAFSLAILGTMLVIPAFLLLFLLSVGLGASKGITTLVSIGCWCAVLGAVWLRFVRVGRSWKKPNLATREFFLFQVAAGAFVLMLTLAFPWKETAASINLIRGLFAVISVLMNIGYVSLAIGIKVSLPPRIFIALAADVAIAVLPLLGK